MTRMLRPLATVAFALVLLWGIARSARAATALIHAPGLAGKTGLVRTVNHPVRPTIPELGAIAAAERAIVFVYAPDCGVCNANMANWTELVEELHGAPIQLFAVAPARTVAASEYWGALARDVSVIMGTPRQVHDAIPVNGTPATLLIENGAVRGMVEGSLTRPARRQIHEFATRGTPRNAH